jgi:catechol 2,3-dioxygenase-like lactoylglutathione lyase family enzyme
MQIARIHHVAYRCRDAKETVAWYRDHLSMAFVLAIAEDHVPSTKAPDPYMHVFLDAGAAISWLLLRPQRPSPRTGGRHRHARADDEAGRGEVGHAGGMGAHPARAAAGGLDARAGAGRTGFERAVLSGRPP